MCMGHAFAPLSASLHRTASRQACLDWYQDIEHDCIGQSVRSRSRQLPRSDALHLTACPAIHMACARARPSLSAHRCARSQARRPIVNKSSHMSVAQHSSMTLPNTCLMTMCGRLDSHGMYSHEAKTYANVSPPGVTVAGQSVESTNASFCSLFLFIVLFSRLFVLRPLDGHCCFAHISSLMSTHTLYESRRFLA